jgi:hypothetical protein
MIRRSSEPGSVFLEGVMRTFLSIIIVVMSVTTSDFTDAVELPVITVAMVSPSWNTNLPIAVARGTVSSKKKDWKSGQLFYPAAARS